MTAAATANDNLNSPLAWSAGMHLLLFGSLAVGNMLSLRGESWGGPGGAAMSVGLVGNLPGVPLPRPEAQTLSRVVDETRGLHRTDTRARDMDAAAKELAEFERNKQQRYITRPSRVLEDPTPPPDNAVPYGQGGAPSLPYTQFQMGAAAQGGLGFSGPGGDFGARFPWYVEAVRRRISGNWLQSTVDPAVRWAPRVVIQFQVLRDGNIPNLQLLRSSGIASVDNSALRAIRDASPLERLPAEYAGGHVMVEFWFDFRRQQ